MAIDIIVPRLGWSMDEGIFGQWLKQEGDLVNEGDALYELESDKATQEVESFDSGILRLPAGVPKPGETVKVGQCVGYLCASDETAPALCSTATKVQQDAQASELSVEGASESVPPSGVNNDAPTKNGLDKTPATPSARRLARKLGVDLRQIDDHEKDGPITEYEVRAAANTHRDASRQIDTNIHRDDRPRENGAGQQRQPRRAASPRAAATAAQLGISIAEISGTGRGGRIRERDVLAAAQLPSSEATILNHQTPQTLRYDPDTGDPDTGDPDTGDPGAVGSSSAAAARLVPSSSIRSTIAERMLVATQQTAQVTLMVKTDATQVLSLRNQCKSASENLDLQVPSVTGMFVKLVAAALQQHPEILQQWTKDGLLVPDGVHIAVAVDTQRGLLAPVLRHVPALTLGDLTRCLGASAERARSGQLAAEELQGGTFTVSNLGAYAVDGFTPILNLPQSAILGIGRIRPEPTVQGDEIVIRDQVSLSLTFDHRVYDGATAAAFLQTLCEILTEPGPWLMQ